MATARDFKQRLCAQVAKQLGLQFRFFKSHMELRAEVPDGYHVVIISGSNKYSPYVGVDFYYGKCFTSARKLEKRLAIYSFPYHVQQYSPNFRSGSARLFTGPTTWSVDATDPPLDLAEQVAEAIRGIANPFWERYESMVAARDAIAEDDPGVFGGPAFWRQLLHLDMALGDLEHFTTWSSRLNDFSRGQADEVIRKYIAHRDA
jgi:hypothetical protein